MNITAVLQSPLCCLRALTIKNTSWYSVESHFLKRPVAFWLPLPHFVIWFLLSFLFSICFLVQWSLSLLAKLFTDRQFLLPPALDLIDSDSYQPNRYAQSCNLGILTFFKITSHFKIGGRWNRRETCNVIYVPLWLHLPHIFLHTFSVHLHSFSVTCRKATALCKMY